jgi:hypothetical protein
MTLRRVFEVTILERLFDESITSIGCQKTVDMLMAAAA